MQRDRVSLARLNRKRKIDKSSRSCDREKKTSVIIVTDSGDASRGDTGELITIDGVDGVVRLSSTNDVVLLDMSCLARRWVE